MTPRHLLLLRHLLDLAYWSLTVKDGCPGGLAYRRVEQRPSAEEESNHLLKRMLAAVEGWVRGPGVDGAKGTSARHLGGPVLDRYRETCQKDGVFMDGRANGGEGRTH